MRLIHYCPHMLAGESDSANSARGWAEALANASASVTCLVDREAVRMASPDGVEIVPVAHNSSGRFRLPSSLEAYVREADLFVLHGGWVAANLVAARAARKAGVPYLITTQGAHYSGGLSSRRKSALRRVWNVAFEHRHLSRALGLHLFFPDEIHGLRRLRVEAPEVIAPNRIAKPNGLNWDGRSGGYLLWLGRFDVETKSLDVLLKALRAMPPKERPFVRLHGPDWRGQKAGVSRMVRNLELQASVEIGHPIYGDEKWALLSKARGFLYPSRWEACPVSVSEAVALGVPTLVAQYPLGKFLASKGGAFAVEPTAVGIARGIRRVTSAEGAIIGSRRGAEIAARDFSWHNVARSWLDQVRKLQEAYRVKAA